MLSIIIASYRQDYFDALSENIVKTIGDIEYEIKQVWNPDTMSIAEAYNTGAQNTKYKNLLFLHEDVEFLNKNWGLIFLKYLQIENVGIIGLAGSLKAFNLPMGFETGLKKYRHIYLKHSKEEIIKPYKNKGKIKVKTLDGVFLGMRKNVWEKLKFNEGIKGFHCYDLDISIRASKMFQNYVIHEISLMHFSLGTFNDSWIKSIISFSSDTYTFDIPTKRELSDMRKYWYNRLANEDIAILNRIKYVIRMGINRSSRKAALHFLFSKPKPISKL